MKPILFNTEMVQAALEGRKTQTRRPFKQQPPEGFYPDFCLFSETGWALWRNKGGCTCKPVPCNYRRGMTLWVRETWRQYTKHEECICHEDEICSCPPTGTYLYKADMPDEEAKWRPSIHMPKEAARLFLVVKSVWPERLQEITEGGAVRDGAIQTGVVWEYNGFRDSFSTIWDSIYGKKHPWDSNPWVWVVEFERTELTIKGRINS